MDKEIMESHVMEYRLFILNEYCKPKNKTKWEDMTDFEKYQSNLRIQETMHNFMFKDLYALNNKKGK